VVTVDRLASERTRIVTQRELALLPTSNDVRILIGFLPGLLSRLLLYATYCGGAQRPPGIGLGGPFLISRDS